MDYACAATLFLYIRNEPVSSKGCKFTCVPMENSDQSVHPHSLIRVLNVRSLGSPGANVSSGGKLRL